VPANVDAAEVFYQHTQVGRTHEGGDYNLWGQVPVPNRGDRPIHYYNLTATGASHSGNYGVALWYRNFVATTLRDQAPLVQALQLDGGLDDARPSTEASTSRVEDVRIANWGPVQTIDGDRPTFSGTAAPGSTLRLYVGPTGDLTRVGVVGTATTADDGTWTLTTRRPLPDGRYRAVVMAYSKALHTRPAYAVVPMAPMGRFVIGAVSACSRRLFEEIGGFDESFTAYGGEDWEWAHRAWQAGAVLAHVPEAVAWHDGPDWSGRDVDRVREGNRQTLRLASDIPVAGSSGRGLLPAVPDLVVHLAGEHSEAAVFVCVDAVLAAFPRATMVLDAPPSAAAFGADPRVRSGAVPDARVIWRLDRPVLLDGVDAFAERLAALGQGEEGRLRVRAADGTALGTAVARRARRRADRWGPEVGFSTGEIVASGIHVLRDEPHLEAWVGGWGGLDRFV
ncbi:MAG: hypothetical protein J0I95_16160, partial [Microbacterium sp.]|uniref:galactosyltransferase-related protein n=1 Tax=Microbacterium sp. TaxID=51671 RepID=UPI001AD190A9